MATKKTASKTGRATSSARKPATTRTAAKAAPVKARKTVKAEKAGKVAKKVQVRAPKAKTTGLVMNEVSAWEADPQVAVDALDHLSQVAEVAVVDDTAALAEEAQAAPESVTAGPTTRYLLPANLELASLTTVQQDLARCVEQPGERFVLDGADLSVIDTGGVQLLVAFVQAMSRRGCEVTWDNYSIQAYQLAEELGLVDHLGE